MQAPSKLHALIAALRADGGDVDVLPPEDAEHVARQSRLEAAFPFAPWGRIDWPRVPGAAIVRTEDPDRLVEQIRTWVREIGDGGERVGVMWSDGLMPMLVIPISAAANHAEEIVMVAWDAWIFPEDARWCIEHYHEGELCLGTRRIEIRGIDAPDSASPG